MGCKRNNIKQRLVFTLSDSHYFCYGDIYLIVRALFN